MATDQVLKGENYLPPESLDKSVFFSEDAPVAPVCSLRVAA